MILILCVCAGGFIGGILRALTAHCGPYVGTLIANLTACFFCGVMSAHAPELSQEILAFAITGIAGALSTWSTLAKEIGELIRLGKYRSVVFYFLCTLLGGILMMHIGLSC
ncbi:FluC/FEX family fluoride channel [Schaalia sp. lx-100]|uniref:FluC/FEX family fluoride channel n=1 Tax=Schaalia sp. lx-100 TaxID=2899081 RepID=UPI001E63F065|nr:CrcB family protein [Schaalia sp. lx-100]MCD4557154.1 CrcB family protein [Schaalia sp. lx-100]